MSDYNTIKLDINNTAATITLNRPEEANGINQALADELADAAQKCKDNSELKVVVLTGVGRLFCGGGDVKEMADSDNPSESLKLLADTLHKSSMLFASMDSILIVALNGTAAGAGFSIMLAADYVVSVDSAKFTMAYTSIGLSPDGGSSYYLPRLIGLRKTIELMVTNRVLTAQEAMEWGLVNEVVAPESLQTRVSELTQQYSKYSRASNAAVKKLMLCTFDNNLQTQLDLESQTIAANVAGVDGQEGITSFVEKRKPDFK